MTAHKDHQQKGQQQRLQDLSALMNVPLTRAQRRKREQVLKKYAAKQAKKKEESDG